MAIQIVIYPLMMVSSKSGTSGLWGGMFAFMIVQLVIFLVVLQVLYRRNKFVDKIVGVEETASPQSQIDWIGFSYRLVSVIAGLYCFYRAANYVSMLSMNIILKSRMAKNVLSIDSQIYSYSIILVVLLAAGVYLLCGAPHFVRWQVKKTKEMFVDTSR